MNTTFVIYPDKSWSFGPFMNHGISKTNVKTVKILTKKGIQVMLIASRSIAKEEEMFYDYNGEYVEYDTS